MAAQVRVRASLALQPVSMHAHFCNNLVLTGISADSESLPAL